MYFYGYRQHQPHAFVNKLNINYEMGLMNNDSLGSPFGIKSNYSTTILNCEMLQVNTKLKVH